MRGVEKIFLFVQIGKKAQEKQDVQMTVIDGHLLLVYETTNIL